MSKTDIRNDGENKKEAPIKLHNWSSVRTIKRLNELVDKYDTLYIVNPEGVPLKVTKAKLV